MDSNRRILIVTSAFPRWLGDFPGFFVFELAKRLLGRGYRVMVLAPDDGRAPKRETMDGIEVVRFSYFRPRRTQRVCYGSGIPDNLRHSRMARVQFPFFVLGQFVALARLVRKEKPDIINAHWIVTQGFNCAALRLLCRSVPPIVLTVHAAGVFALNRAPAGGFIARFILRRCRHVFAVSSYVLETLKNLSQKDFSSSVVPMGIDAAEFFLDQDPLALRRSRNLPSGTMLLYIGRLADKKGINYLLEAMPAVLRAHPATYLVICGEGHLEAALKAQAERLGLKEAVRFMGSVAHDQVVEYLNMADLVVIPSIVDSKGQTEGLPVVLMEALAAGRPAVAGAVSGMRDAIRDGENGFLVRPADSDHLAERIIQALGRDLGSISEAARISGREYDWERIVDQYQALFQSWEA